MDRHTRLFRIGIAGTAFAALCCVTPILSVILGALGVAAWIGYADYVLFPALAAFAGLAVYAWRRRAEACCTTDAQAEVRR
jgi:mercuric ion transport protein